MAIEKDRLYTVEQVADITSSPSTSVRDWLQTGQVEGVKLGRGWRVTGEELQRLMREGTRPPRDAQEATA